MTPGRAPNERTEMTKTWNGVAIAAFVLQFIFPPLGMILGIVAIVQISNSKGRQKGMVLAVLALVMPIFLIGVMVAIAVPNFVRYQLRSKQYEAKANLAGLRTGMEAFAADYDGFISTPATPNPSGLSTEIRSWAAEPCAEACRVEDLGACESTACLGFKPVGVKGVRYAYACSTNEARDAFTCAALGDLDGDGELSLFIYLEPGSSGLAPVPDFDGLAPACEPTPGEIFNCTPGRF